MESTGKCFVSPQLSYSGPAENMNSAFWVGMKETQMGLRRAPVRSLKSGKRVFCCPVSARPGLMTPASEMCWHNLKWNFKEQCIDEENTFVGSGVLFGSPKHTQKRGLTNFSPYGLICESLEIRFLFAQA